MKKPLLIITLFSLIVGCASTKDTVKKMAFWKGDAPDPKELTELKQTVPVVLKEAYANIGYTRSDEVVNIQPGVTQNLVVIAGPNGTLRVHDRNNHQKIWEVKVQRGILAGPSIDEYSGHVAVIDKANQAIVLDLKDGKPVYRVQLPEESYAMPVVEGDELVIKTLSEDVRVYSLSGQKLLWSYQPSVEPISIRETSRPLISGQQIVVGFSDGRVISFDRFRGKLLWEAMLNDERTTSDVGERYDIVSDPIQDSDNFYLVSFDGVLAAIDKATGEKRWKQSIGTYKNLAQDADRLFAVGKDDTVYAIRKDTGRIIWRQEDLQYRRLSAPLENQGRLIVVDNEGYVHWLKSDTGMPMARYKLARPLNGSMLAAKGKDILVTTDYGTVQAISAG